MWRLSLRWLHLSLSFSSSATDRPSSSAYLASTTDIIMLSLFYASSLRHLPSLLPVHSCNISTYLRAALPVDGTFARVACRILNRWRSSVWRFSHAVQTVGITGRRAYRYARQARRSLPSLYRAVLLGRSVTTTADDDNEHGGERFVLRR